MNIDLNTYEGRELARQMGLNVPQEQAANVPCGRRGEEGPRTADGGPKWTEKQFQAKVIAYAEDHGWVVYHTHDSRRSQPGFPDLVLVRERVIFAELKTDKGKLSAEQTEWRDRLIAAGAWYGLWSPRCWELILDVLK